MKKSLSVLAVAAAFFCASVFSGCSKKAQQVSEIKIGSIGPLSGAVAVYGTDCKNGIDLAVEEINAAGGVNGQMFVVVSEDDEGNPEKSVSAYKKLVTKDEVKMIIGSLTSGCTMAISTLAQAQKVLLIAPAATATAITDAGNYVFRTCFIDPFQGTVGAKFALATLGSKRAAILYDAGNDYSVGLAENFEKTFVEAEGEIVAKESYGTGDKDFNAQITKIKSVNPDVVYLPDYYGTVALIAKQLSAQGLFTPMIGADGWDGLQDNAGDEVLNGYFSNHYASDSTSPAVQKFVQSYTDKYGKAPTSFGALGYDSVYLLKDAIIRAGSTEIEAIRDAVEKSDGEYVTGHLKFDEHRNPIKSAVIVELVKDENGKLTTVYKTTVNP